MSIQYEVEWVVITVAPTAELTDALIALSHAALEFGAARMLYKGKPYCHRRVWMLEMVQEGDKPHD